MKNKRSARSDLRYRYRTRVIANIMYSTLLACLVEIFLIVNLSMLSEYAQDSQWDNALLVMIYHSDPVITVGYVLIGIMVFSIAFLLLQEKSIGYIDRISQAVRNISEGDLNTSIEVVGDDEFSSMAEKLNKMVEEIRRLMDKERKRNGPKMN